MPLKFIINQKGGKNLILDGFIDTLHRTFNDKIT